MGKDNWFRRERKRAQGESRRKRAAAKKPQSTSLDRTILSLEALEERRVLATFIVNNTADSDPDGVAFAGSLRWAVERANLTEDPDTIIFSDNIFNGGQAIISLNDDQIDVTQPLRILGPGAGKLTVNADANSRIFNLAIGADDEIFGVEISGLTLSRGNITGTDDEDRGGAIYNREALTMTEVIVSNNRASQGGGGIYVEFGSLNVDRSLFLDNTGGGIGGGGILNGIDADDSRPSTTVTNSTFVGNRAPAVGTNIGFGGGLLNRNGSVDVAHSTFVDNTSGSELGEGIASYGNPGPEDEESDPPPPTIFTTLTHSVVYRQGGSSDVDVVGEPEDEEALPLETSFENLGYNLIGAAGELIEPGDGDLPVGTDPRLLPLDDYGGSTPTMLPNNDPENPDFDGISPLIDAGNPEVEDAGDYEQRGRHFTRIFNATETEDPIIDIGAAEVQRGSFFVDSLIDESDLQFSGFTDPDTKAIDIDYESGNDFSLREALDFSSKNPEVDTIRFANSLRNETDPTVSTAPTILLSSDFGSLWIDHQVIIEGPSTYILEIDASGTDETPSINDGFGTQVFTIYEGDFEELLDIEISNLTLMGADQVGVGGAIYSNENLTLRSVTFKENYATLEGGGVFIQFGNLEVYDSTFSNNSVSGNGGAIFVNTGDSPGSPITALIVNSTISGNTAAGRGGGIGNENGHVVIRNSTITLNSAASTRGSGVFTFGDPDARTEVYSSVISGNLNNDIEYSTGANNTVSLGYNLIGRGNASFAFTETGDRRNILNPMLAPLKFNGGLVQTHRPLVGSPLIDMGNPLDEAGVGETPENDQRGSLFTRVFDATGLGEFPAVIDIGAYELQPVHLIVDSLGNGDDGDYTEGNFSLREAIAIANDNPLPDFIDMTGLFGDIAVFGTSLIITDSVTIEGPDWFSLQVSGNAMTSAPIFVVDDGNANSHIDVFFSGMAIESARAGAILSHENLDIDEIFFQANRNAGFGGAIQQQTGTLRITDSQFSGNSTSGIGSDGGAIYAADALVEIEDTLFAGNVTFASGSDGGGIALKNSTLNATATTISGNQAPGGASDGGGIYADASTVNLTDSTVSGNFTTGSNSEGGGIAAYNSSAVNMVDSVVSLNRTTGSQSSGGGVYLSGGTLTMLRSMITQNTTSGQSAAGGGLAMIGGSASIVESGLQGNSTTNNGGHGGAIYNVGGNLLLRSSSVIENSVAHAQSKGGGVYSDTNLAGTQSTQILNTTISGNSAGLRGGGVFNADGLMEIRHSTITNNSTPFMNVGNGVASQATAATLTKVYSSIIAGNVGATGGTGSDVDSVDGSSVNSIQSLGYNVIGVGNAKTLFNAAGDQSGITNPMLGPLQDNGGNPANPFSVFTHALLAGSPAINAGSPTFTPNAYTPALTTDQRGDSFARVKSGRIDAGAFESDLAPALPADFNGNGWVEGTDFLAWQRNYGKTGAIKANGDANGDGSVNSSDLAVWRSSFGSTSAVAPAASASSTANVTAALMAAEEDVVVATTTSSEPAADTSDDQPTTSRNRFNSLASLGRTTAPADSAPEFVLDESLLWNGVAAPVKRIVSVFLDDEKSADLDLLLADEAGSEAEDAVFAAWGEEIL